jgi:hypothetical protein
MVDSGTVGQVSWLGISTLGSDSIPVTGTASTVAGHVECTYINPYDGSTLVKTSNAFNIAICSPAVGAIPDTVYMPVLGDTSQTSIAGPTVTYTHTNCLAEHTNCDMVTNCATKALASDLTCSISASSALVHATTINYQKGSTYPSVFFHIYKTGPTNSICTAVVPIVYDCSAYMIALTDISDYLFTNAAAMGASLDPNNGGGVWI